MSELESEIDRLIYIEREIESEIVCVRERESERPLARWAQTCKKQSMQKKLCTQRCSCSAGFEATEAVELVGDYNDCHNSTKHDHGAGMCDF